MIKAFAAFLVSVLTLSSSVTAACAPSQLVKGGCRLLGTDSSGVDVHYALAKNNSMVSFALRAMTPGYVAIAFVANGQDAMFPSDAVVGWAGASNAVMGYSINGYQQKDVVGSGILLTNTSVSEIAGKTTVRFTRRTRTGRFPIDPAHVTFNLAQGPTDGLTKHKRQSTVAANLLTGKRLALSPSSPVSPSPTTASPLPLSDRPLQSSSLPVSHSAVVAVVLSAIALCA